MNDELKDVRPPVDLPPDHSLLYFLAAVLAVALAVLIARFFLEKRHGIFAAFSGIPSAPVKSAWEIAQEELAALKAENLPAKGEVKEYFFRLSGIVRHYLEDRFSLSAPEMTTDEFLIHLNTTDVLNSLQKESLKEFLTASDMVKFARYGANPQEIENAFLVAKRLVEETIPQKDAGSNDERRTMSVFI